MRRMAFVIALVALAGCSVKVPRELADHYKERTLHTCCNMFYRGGGELTDANYRDGELVPLGSKEEIKKLGVRSMTFEAAGKEVVLSHVYGTEQETYKEYFDKILVEADRGKMVERFPMIIQRTIADGRVEKGMKRGEVVLAVGFPPTDDNPSPESNEWKFWYSKGNSYTVKFDANGYVHDIAGMPAPTLGKPVRVYRGQYEQQAAPAY